MPPIPGDENDATVSREQSPVRSDPARFAAGQLVAGRFRIVAPLGHGGMGEVFRADDLRLAQTVALKFLSSRVAASPDAAERLVAEVRIGRQVSHPNLCRLYDLVEADGIRFVSMEFIDGEDLSSLLRRIGRVSSDKAGAFSRQICAGLAAAHDLGVIHRDLKPANVMIDGRGVARITDFGLAIEGTGGGFAGTPAYMAPEQLDGRPATESSDIYALGLVLWEIVTGRRLFDGSSLEEIRRQHAAPKGRPSFFAPDLDPALEREILACLSESPSERPRSVRQILDGLRDLDGAVTHSSGSSTPAPRRASSDRETAATSIAVLPFEDLGGDDDAFAVGLAEEIIADLGKIKSLRVIARGSVMRFKGAQSCRPVALELGVTYVLTGTLRKAGNQLRVTTSLVEGASESLVWSEKFKGTLDDIFDIQEEISRRIASQLAIELTSEEKAVLAERPIDDPIVYEQYLRARDRIWSFSRQALERAIVELEASIARAGEKPLLLAALATAWWQYVNGGIDTSETNLEKAEALAARIDEIEPDSHHCHRVLGYVAMARGDTRTALRHLRTVVARCPNETESLVWLSTVYVLSGLDDRARPHIRHLEQIDPLGSLSPWASFFQHWLTGNFPGAVEAVRRMTQISPEGSVYPAQIWLLSTLARRNDEAALAAALLDANDEHAFFVDQYRFLSSALAGRRDDAHQAASHIREQSRLDLQYSMQMAEGHALLGEADEAIDWLTNAVNRGFLAWEYLAHHDWFLDGIRDDPRFAALLDRVARERDELRASLS